MPSCIQRRLLFGTDEERPAKCLESTLDGIPHFLGAVFWAYEGEKCGQRFLFVTDNVSRVARIRHLVSMMTPCAEYLAAYLHSFSSIAGSHKLNTGALHHISFLMNIWGVDMRCKYPFTSPSPFRRERLRASSSHIRGERTFVRVDWNDVLSHEACTSVFVYGEKASLRIWNFQSYLLIFLDFRDFV